MGYNSDAEKYFYFLLQKGYESMINSCTLPKNVGSCLDHISIKTKLRTAAEKMNEMITDHYPILLYFHGNNIKCKEKERIEIDKKNH